MAYEKPSSFTQRLKEIDRFFQGRSAVHQSMRRLAARLRKASIPYAIFGGMAVNAHGHRQTTDDVDVLLTSEGLVKFRGLFLGRHYASCPERRGLRFSDRKNDIPVDVVVMGTELYSHKGVLMRYPDPAVVSQLIQDIPYVNLKSLIELKLAIGRFRDLGDVGALIRVQDLGESFLQNLLPAVHEQFMKCLEEKRREDEYEAKS